MAQNHSKDTHTDTPLGITDVICGLIFFGLCAWGVYQVAGPDGVGFVKGKLPWERFLEMLVSGGLFLVLWGVLGRLLLMPYLEVATQREERTQGDEQKALDTRRKSKELLEKVEVEIQHARLEGIKRRDLRIEEAKKQSEAILEAARVICEGEKLSAQTALKQEEQKARAELDTEAEKLAVLVVERTLASEPRVSVH